MNIKNLPRLPRPAATGVLHQRRYIGSVYTSNQIRARDIKVWNMAMEVASNVCDDQAYDRHLHAKGGMVAAYNACAAAIRALKEQE